MRFSSIWESDPAWKSPDVLWWSGVLTLVLYAGFAILLPSVGSPAETLCALLGLGLCWRMAGIFETAPPYGYCWPR